MRRRLGMILAAALTVGLIATGASADSDELMGCKIGIVKAPPATGGYGMTKFVCRGTFALPSAAAAPTPGGWVNVGVNADPPGIPEVLPLSGSICVGLGSPSGSKGYKCSAAPASILLIKANVVKAVFKFDFPLIGYESPHPFASGNLRVLLQTIGTSDSKRYCALFTSPSRNDPTQYTSKVAPPPAACSPSGAFLAEDGGLF